MASRQKKFLKELKHVVTLNSWSVNYSEKLIELDGGLFHIFNAETFTDSYITPDVEIIPTTIAYKPS